MIKIIAFLGNACEQYANTRHNLPWMLIDSLSFSSVLTWKEKFKGVFALYQTPVDTLYLVKPHTFMNKSGDCIQSIMHFYKVTHRQLLVVHDDTELDYGCIDFKSGGGLAGHNGLRHLAASIHTKDFNRFRLGIGRPLYGNLSAFVLGKFSPDETCILPLYLKSAAEALEIYISVGFDTVKDRFQKKCVIP